MRGGQWSSSLRARVERGVYTETRSADTSAFTGCCKSRAHLAVAAHESIPLVGTAKESDRATAACRISAPVWSTSRPAIYFEFIARQISGSRVCLTYRSSSAQYFHRGAGLDYVHTMEQSLPRADGEPSGLADRRA
jgi:hypothetical protein